MPVLTAERIHNGHGWLPLGSAIEVAGNGTIIGIANAKGATHYEGILAPGFVNVHCHLELSHMKGVVPEHTGLIPFLKDIPGHRNDFTDGQKKSARHAAYQELVENGIVALGDIANTADTLDVRAAGSLHCHTFVETLGFNETNAVRSFGFATDTYATYAAQSAGDKLLRQSIVPHAPYSVSSGLFRLINEHNEQAIISIHNQESPEEDLYFQRKEGAVRDLLHTLGIDDSAFSPSGMSSLRTYAQWLSPTHPLVLVHNTCTGADDIQMVQERYNNLFFCLCPNANLYIENRLPDINMLISQGAHICIGTDSLASNHQLSILAELYTIKRFYPGLSWETLLTWGTRNGATALQFQGTVGTIEPGKTPGILQIVGIDKPESTPVVKRLI